MPIDTRNQFGVQKTALGPIVQNPPPKGDVMTADDALNLASYLIIAAGQSAEYFEAMLGLICHRVAADVPTASKQ